MAFIKIGISGWTYPRWRGSFYPEGLAAKNELAFSSQRFNSIEINGSFYRLQSPYIYRSWYDTAPDDFIFAVKGSRFITHMKKLRDIQIPLANFFASGVLELKEKLGPILWQLPPNLKFDPGRLEDFFQTLPLTVQEAALISQFHDERVADWEHSPRSLPYQPLRYALEVRHPTYQSEACIELLRKYGIALVIADTAGKFPYLEDMSSDFVYVRLHGHKELYAGGYDDEALDWWAERIRSWSKGRNPENAVLAHPTKSLPGPKDVYVYFDNDIKVHAPFDAMALAKRLLKKRYANAVEVELHV